MSVTRHLVYRDKALKHYTQGKKRDILPNFSSISTMVFLWVLISLLLATGLLAWYVQVPQYTLGTGILVSRENHGQTTSNKTIAVIFFAPDAASKLHAGQTVQITMSVTGLQVTSVLTEIEPGTSSPATVLQRYGLKVQNPAPNQSEVVALTNLGQMLPDSVYTGSAIGAQVNTGSQSLFSAITGIKV